MKEWTRPSAMAAASAVLIFLSLPPAGLWWLAPLALAPWYLALRRVALRRGAGAAVLGGALVSYLGGFLTLALSCYWLGMVSVAGLLMAAFIGGLYYAAWGAATVSLLRWARGPAWLGAASLWCLTEYLRSRLGWLAFPWALLPHALYERPALVQAASLWGVWGYSWLLSAVPFALVDAALHLRLRRRLRAALAPAAPIAAVAFVLVFGALSTDVGDAGPTVTLGLVQGNVPQEAKEEAIAEARSYTTHGRSKVERVMDEHLALSERLLAGGPVDLLIWPETMVPGSMMQQPERFRRMVEFVERRRTPVLLGSERHCDGRFYNSAYLIGADGRVLETYDKMTLVPVGEYIPAQRVLALLALITSKLMPYETLDLSPGSRMTIFEVSGFRFYAPICFELSFDDQVREAARAGAQVIVNISNDAWFKDSAELDLAVAQAVFRAVETRTPVVRVVNAGITRLVDAGGRITYLERRGRRKQVAGTLRAEVRPARPERRTLHLLAGSWAPVAAVVVVLLLLAPGLRKRLKRDAEEA